jgi:ABC-type uncharacterized transport system permease subunit
MGHSPDFLASNAELGYYRGMAAGIGGAYLSLAYTQMWIDNMTAGRGSVLI